MTGMVRRTGWGLVPLLAAGLCACGGAREDVAAATDYGDAECVEIPDGYYLFADGKFSPATPELATAAAQVTQKQVAWVHAFEEQLAGEGYDWLKLEKIGNVLVIGGEAATVDVRDAAEAAVRTGIASDRTLASRNLYVVDAIAIEGEGRAPASLYASMAADPSVELCRTKADQLSREGSITYGDTDASVGASSYRLLDAMAGLALICDDYRLEVGVHTDARGEQGYNLARSQTRAETIAAYLEEAGVPAARLVPVGYGENHPLDPAQTSEAYALNSRVEFFFLRPPE